MNDIKTCVACKHYSQPYGPVTQCQAPKNTKPNLINGGVVCLHSLESLRKDVFRCGPDGAWWEAIPPKPKKGFLTFLADVVLGRGTTK